MEEKILAYRREGDYLVPDLEAPEAEERPIGKYGRLRLKYLKEHRRGTYSALMIQGKLESHLADVEEQALEQMNRTLEELKRRRGLTEALKSSDPLGWVGQMNALKQQAEELVLAGLIYT